MKDQLFSGPTVEAALTTAATALGLRPEQLRYVVLERETGARLGLSATPARIAVILDVRTPPGARGATPPGPAPAGAAGGPRELIAALSRALGQELEAEIEGPPERALLRLSGPGGEVLFDAEGRAFQALEHLLGRICSAQGLPVPRLSCEAYRNARDLWLARLARELGAAVLRDGQPRETEPMNAYDRRQVHTAIGELGGLVTRSVGEGGERRVTILPAGEATGA